MSDFVLDASITLAWCFSDEATPKTLSLLENLEENMAFAPEIWPLEVGNILIQAQRKNRITYANISEYLALLNSLNIQIDRETAPRGLHEIISLAYTEKLSTYDAAYLELALRLGLPLATKDTQLSRAAARLGVKVING